MHAFIDWILATVSSWGYTGVFILMALESTVLPVPSELVLIPAGYLAQQGQMGFLPLLLSSTFGSLAGASLNYYFALRVGRPFLERYGSYFFVQPAVLQKTDAFFVEHGAISTFTGRLIPGIRHLISLPAGLTRMNFTTFSAYTCLGAGLWSVVLIVMGYVIGDNEALIKEHLPLVTISLVVLVALLLAGYVYWRRRLTA